MRFLGMYKPVEITEDFTSFDCRGINDNGNDDSDADDDGDGDEEEEEVGEKEDDEAVARMITMIEMMVKRMMLIENHYDNSKIMIKNNFWRNNLVIITSSVGWFSMNPIETSATTSHCFYLNNTLPSDEMSSVKAKAPDSICRCCLFAERIAILEYLQQKAYVQRAKTIGSASIRHRCRSEGHFHLGI